MKKEYEYKSPEAAENERRHWFGQPGGNKICDQRIATNQREFYKWCESTATKEELLAYARDESKPYARRKFVQSLTNCETVQDFFDLTNQTHGQPKQTIEQTNLPEVHIVLE